MDARSSSARRTNPFKARSRTSDRSFCEPPGFTSTQNLRADCVFQRFSRHFSARSSGTGLAKARLMHNTDRIDFISAYCDSWCERCAYTSRCSAFAVRAAIAMCDDPNEGLELAVGIPHPVEETQREPPRAWFGFENTDITEQELNEAQRSEEARHARVEATATMKSAWAIPMTSMRWLRARAETVRAAADDVLKEALEIAQWDATFVTAKLGRALDGRDRHEHGEDFDDHPVQNDWNGSAKVALISLERSEMAWRVIAESTGEDEPAALAEHVAALRREVERAFPNAYSFIRPGFDEPDR
jgi:hypothetical protein